MIYEISPTKLDQPKVVEQMVSLNEVLYMQWI